jgi:RNA polymerase sigma-70 factor, ECF subfamily
MIRMKTLTQNNDRLDVLQACEGDDSAFTNLVERYQTSVFNLCYRMLGDPKCAEDAAQECFLRAYCNIRRFDPGRSFEAWLLSISAHYCIDQLRRRKIRFISLDQPSEDNDLTKQLTDERAIHPEAALVVNEEQSALLRAMDKMTALDRAVIILRYWYDMSCVEIAGTLNISVPAVKSRLFRAKRELVAKLDQSEKQNKKVSGLQLAQFTWWFVNLLLMALSQKCLMCG